jgi:transcriptional regulator with XRE-family HTH domain
MSRRGPTAQTNFSGARLRELRLARGWSRSLLAVASGCSWTSIGDYERGYRADTGAATFPSAESALRLAAALGVELDDLLVRERHR